MGGRETEWLICMRDIVARRQKYLIKYEKNGKPLENVKLRYELFVFPLMYHFLRYVESMIALTKILANIYEIKTLTNPVVSCVPPDHKL